MMTTRPCAATRFLHAVTGGLVALGVTLGVLGACASGLHAQPSPNASAITASDLLKIQQISDVTISPDGRTAAYVVKRIEETPDEDRPYTYRRQIYAVPSNGRSEPQVLTRAPEDATSPAWHPNSDRLAFVRSVDGTPQIFVLPVFGGEPYQLTDTPRGATDPQWGPNGRRLLFAASVPRLHVAREMAEGTSFPEERPGRTASDTLAPPSFELRVVLRDSLTLDPLDTLAVEDTSLATLADSLGALRDTVRQEIPDAHPPSPDGTLLQIRKWLGERRVAEDPKVITRLDFQGERALNPDVAFRHLFVVDVPAGVLSGSPPRPEPRPLTSGYRSFGGADWLPSGTQVVVSGSPDAPVHPDRVRQRDLYVAEVPGPGEAPSVRRLLRLERHALSDPQVSEDGTTVAFLARSLDQSGYAQSEVGLFTLDGRSKPQIITSDFDRSASQIRWSPDGWYLYTVTASEGAFPLMRFAPFARSDTSSAEDSAPQSFAPPVETSTDVFALDSTMVAPVEPEVLTDATRGIRSYDATDATLVYAATSVGNPFELYTSTVGATGERRLSSHNASWLADKTLASHEPIDVVSDSVAIDAWVIRPPGLRTGQQAPLLVEMHGGPSAMWGPGEATMWHEFQLLAARGFAIVYSNPRGSGGYGTAFRTANFQDWGNEPMQDVLAAADVAAELPWTDASRQVLTGGSYAGYLTAWMVSQTDRFEAAVAQRGVYDLAVFFGEGNAWRLVPTHFGGYPWEGTFPSALGDTAAVDSSYFADGRTPGVGVDSLVVDSLRLPPRDALLRNSPQTYVRDIRTPLLIMHADDDLRTGVIQSELLYRSLKVLDRPVEYVRYPNAGHDLSRTGDPLHRIDRLLRIYEFLARYTSGRPEGLTDSEAP